MKGKCLDGLETESGKDPAAGGVRLIVQVNGNRREQTTVRHRDNYLLIVMIRNGT